MHCPPALAGGPRSGSNGPNEQPVKDCSSDGLKIWLRMKKIVLYSVTSTIIWYAMQAVGVGFGVSLFASLMGPPALLMVLIIYRMNRPA